MKRLYLLPLLALLTFAASWAQTPQQQRRQVVVYGVAFYNLENLFDTINNNGKYDLEYSPQGSRQWTGERYRNKINNLARVITAMTTKSTPNGPAVIGVSEIENKSVLDDLVRVVDEQLTAQGREPWNLQVVHHDSPDRRGVDVACLYNPRQFRYLDVSNTTLRIPNYDSFRTRDQMCVTGILGGDTLSVIVNHWPSRLGGQEQSSYLREAAGTLSKEIADSLWRLRPNQGVIVMGDLNDDPHDRSCAVALGAKRDIDEVADHGFYNPWWKILDKGIGTLAYKGQWNLFDQIIVSGTLLQRNGAKLYFKNAKVNNFDFLKDTEGQRQNYPLRTFAAGSYLNGYSDHFPTEVFLVKERQAGNGAATGSPAARVIRANAVARPVTTVQHPDWSRDAVIYEINWRQTTPGGTIKELEALIPHYKELGADILWMMPIHPISKLNRKGELGSYYAVADYKAVNPELGTLDEFKDFVKKAHEQGMKVIIDWVPNHTGCDNVWVAAHPDYYTRDKNGNMQGIYDWTDVYELDYDNPELRKAMIDAMKFWLTEADIDGFRCDVAMEVPTDFWNEARPQLEVVKPGNFFMLAEAPNPDLVEHAFDMDYNWPMKDVFNAVAATSGQRAFDDAKLPESDANAIFDLLDKQAADFPIDSYMMNMITNHDLNSWEGTEFQRLGNLTDAFAVLSFTLPGMPLIYTGQETGMDRAFEFFTKDKPPEFEPRNKYFDFYRRLTDLKHGQKAVQAGIVGGKVVRYPTKSNNLVVFSRSVDGSNVLVMANVGNKTEKVEYTGLKPDAKLFTTRYLSSDQMGKTYESARSPLPATLAPGDYYVFISE